jgi:hypothetical protein
MSDHGTGRLLPSTSPVFQTGKQELTLDYTELWQGEPGARRNWGPPQEGSFLDRGGNGRQESQVPKEQSWGMNKNQFVKPILR